MNGAHRIPFILDFVVFRAAAGRTGGDGEASRLCVAGGGGPPLDWVGRAPGVDLQAPWKSMHFTRNQRRQRGVARVCGRWRSAALGCVRWAVAPEFQAVTTSMCNTEVSRHCVAGGGAPLLCCAHATPASELQPSFTLIHFTLFTVAAGGTVLNTDVSRHCVAGGGARRSDVCARHSPRPPGCHYFHV